MATSWEPDQYLAEFRERLHNVIQQRMKAHGVVKRKEEEPDVGEGAATNVVDFMALLQQSIDRNKRTPARKAAPKPATAKKTPRKAAPKPAKKPAKKATAKAPAKAAPRKRA